MFKNILKSVKLLIPFILFLKNIFKCSDEIINLYASFQILQTAISNVLAGYLFATGKL